MANHNVVHTVHSMDRKRSLIVQKSSELEFELVADLLVPDRDQNVRSKVDNEPFCQIV